MNSNIFFQPFVGKDYANGGIFGKQIMILGESHYCDESCSSFRRLLLGLLVSGNTTLFEK